MSYRNDKLERLKRIREQQNGNPVASMPDER